jgi:hypothetical protein
MRSFRSPSSTYRGIYEAGSGSFDEPKIATGNINAQETGILLTSTSSREICNVTIRRHRSGWKGGSAAWYGIKANACADLKISGCTIQPDESSGAFTGTMTAIYLLTCSLSQINNNFIGVGNDAGITLDNCTGIVVDSTISAQNGASNLLFNLVNNARASTIGAYELVSTFAGTVLTKDGTITGVIQMMNKDWDLQGSGTINCDITRTSSAANTKKWRTVVGAAAQNRQTVNDAGTGTNYELVTRTGSTVDSIEWRATLGTMTTPTFAVAASTAVTVASPSMTLSDSGNINWDISRTGSAADTKRWRTVVGATSRNRQTVSDALVATNYEIVTRTGTVVDSIEWRASLWRYGSGGPTYTVSNATPEGAITAPIGSVHSRTNGGASTSVYFKESGAGNTGWIGK